MSELFERQLSRLEVEAQKMSSQLLSMALDDIVKMGSKDRGTRGGRRRFGRGGSRARIAKPYNVR